ncbi:MAG TPA: molybdate ABC transporter substrate-binding protein [Methylomirabilota bacterium]|nr:molybdate ABC transporter substrate-binding protein [Methylomirabilota bacterium]
MPSPTPAAPRSMPVLILFGGIAFLTLVFGLIAAFYAGSPAKNAPLLVHCAASLKTVATEIAAAYERDTGVRIELSFGGSQTLLANISISQRGDLFLPADDSYIALAREKNLVTSTFSVAEQSAVIAVQKGNPKRIRSLADFRNASLTLSQANPEAAAIGKLLRETTAVGGLWQSLSNRAKVFKPTVIDAANDVKLGAVDAAVVWDSMQKQYPDLDFVRAPELENVKAKVAISVLKCSAQSEAAEGFARYVAAPEHGMRHFQTNGFRPLPASP